MGKNYTLLTGGDTTRLHGKGCGSIILLVGNEVLGAIISVYHMSTKKHICSIIHSSKDWKQSKCLSAREQMNKMWYIHRMESYAVLIRNRVLIRSPVGVNLKNIILHERSQTQKTTYWVIPFIWNVQKENSIEIENRLVVAWGGVWE